MEYTIKINFDNAGARDKEHLDKFLRYSIESIFPSFCSTGNIISVEREGEKIC